MRRLGRFLVGQVEPSGAVLAYYDTRRDRPVPDEYSKYYTGEAYWALARLARTFPDEDFAEAANRIGTYLATERDDREGYWPPIPDHWAEYGMSESTPLTAAELAYARRQAELWGGQARWVQQRFAPWGAVVRGPAVFRGGWYGVMNEGFTGLWRIARAEPGLADIQGSIAARATCIAGIAVHEQASARGRRFRPRPITSRGRLVLQRRRDPHGRPAARPGLAPANRGHRGSRPTGCRRRRPVRLALGARLVLALNPARAAFGIPRAGRSSREVAWLCAAGGAIGGLAVCVFAALGDPVLDTLDVSTPAFRTAAGAIALFAGVVDLVRRPPHRNRRSLAAGPHSSR